jgi:hypothetical protein
MLVHKDAPQIEKLLDLMYDPNGFYLIHVDTKSPILYKHLLNHVFHHYHTKGYCNVKVVSKWHVVWGAGSIVLSQLDLFFQALELQFDFIVNMSGYCLPMYQTTQLHKILTKSKYKAWMRVDRDEQPERVQQVRIPNRQGSLSDIDQDRNYKPALRYPAWKHDQWMILSRGVVDDMKKNPETFDLLAWFEYTFIPDEHYFATLLMQRYPHDVFTGSVWLRIFKNDYHPIWLKKENVKGALPNEYFARKIQLLKEPDLVEYIVEKWRNDLLII